MHAVNLLYDFAIAAALLFVAKILRCKLKFIQRAYIPAALLAGFLGLFLGPQFLDVLPFSQEIGNYPSILISVLFGSMFVGTKDRVSVKSVLNGAGDTLLVNGASEMMQFALFTLIGVTVLPMVFGGINEAFGLMLPAGFVGGHGTAAAIGGVLAESGWADASTIGQTFATVGLLGGILLGVALINLGARRGWTKVIKGVDELPEEMLTGLVPGDKAASLGKSTTNGVSIDSLTWHACLVLVSVGMAYLVNEGLKVILPSVSFPTYGLALLCGIVVQFALKATKLDANVDRDVITHIGSSATDFLVVFGIASIKVSVVVRYWVPIIVLAALGFLFVIAWLLLVSRRFFRRYWFEHGIYIFGMSTGVLATGVILLRITDPEFRTGVLEDFGLAWIVLSVMDALLVAFAPVFVVAGQGVAFALALVAASVVALALCRFVFGRKKHEQEGEQL
ncbi:MAG: hypothetical protein Q4C41_03740 [Eggerthellaceae bacterium]|nr:hypothetical protein [Eggerthellaceae bacterium]